MAAPTVTRRLIEHFVGANSAPVRDQALLEVLTLRDRIQAVILGYQTGLVMVDRS